MTPAARIGHLANVMLASLLGLLAGRMLFWQLVAVNARPPVVVDPAESAYTRARDGARAATFDELPQPVVQRTVALLAGIQRGTIYDRAGRVLAYDEATENGPVRRYAEASLAHVVGYVSGLRTGAAGLERSLNRQLLGLDRLDYPLAEMLHQPVVGSNLYLTIDERIQGAAAQALGGRPGAVVVMDAPTGAILAMASAPGFDPNRVEEQGYLAGLAQNCSSAPNCQGAMLNRATQGLYPPGSTFKTVTLVAALESGLATPATVIDFGAPLTDTSGARYYVYEVGGGAIVDYNHVEPRLTLEQAYAVSANAAFARLGDELGADLLLEYAARLGFSSPRGAPPIEIDASAAQVADDPRSLYGDDFLRAATAIGQGDLLASPLTMALVVAAVLNDGDMPSPHLVQAVRSPDGQLLQGEPSGYWIKDTMRPETARQVREMMLAVVSQGSGSAAAVPGLTVGGKTGTAQLGGAQEPHAWFTGFAQDGEHSLVIAVLIENGGQGSKTAAPIFAKVAEAAMRYLSQPGTATQP